MLNFAKAWGPADNYDKSTHIGKMKSHDFLSLLIKFLPGEDTLRFLESSFIWCGEKLGDKTA